MGRFSQPEHARFYTSGFKAQPFQSFGTFVTFCNGRAISGRASLDGRDNLVGMPKVFEEDGYRFFFYSNEHRPIHVHVRYGTGEAVFMMEPAIELRESHGLKVRELSKAQSLAEKHEGLIMQKWYEHLD